MKVDCIFAGDDISYGRALGALLRRFLVGGFRCHSLIEKTRESAVRDL